MRVTTDSLLTAVVRLSATHWRLHAWHHWHTHLAHVHHHRIHLSHLSHSWHLAHLGHLRRHLAWNRSSLWCGSCTTLVLPLKKHLLSINLLLEHGNLLMLPQHDCIVHHLLLLWSHLTHVLLSLSHVGSAWHLHSTWLTHHTSHRESHASHVWHTEWRLLSSLCSSLSIFIIN